MKGIHIFKNSKKSKRNKELFIILTVPHAICKFPMLKHNCDLIAPESAIFLSRILDDYNILHTIIMGDTNRDKSDLNREESAKLEFHKKLNNIIFSYKNIYNLILLDIHSGSFDDAMLIILKQKRFEELELLNLIQNYTNAIIMVGGEPNFIVEKALKENIPALLFEFNEKQYYTLNYYERIVKAIKEWDDHNLKQSPLISNYLN